MKIISIDTFEAEAIVVGNGCFPNNEQALSWLRNPDLYKVCCDGAADEFIKRMGKMPNAVVGDFDSISSETAVALKNIMHKVEDPEINDQTKAVNFLTGLGYHRLAILGATGKREDHTLGNISLLIDYMRMGIDVRMYTDYGVFIPCCDETQFSCCVHQPISIFSMKAKGFRSEGLKYPLHELENWWNGTLNTTLDTHFVVKAEGDYLVYMAYPE